MVLVVEDEFLLRMDAADMITAAGFEAIIADAIHAATARSRELGGA